MNEHPNDELLKRAWAADHSRADDSEDCPDDESIYDAATGGADRDRRQQIVEHTARCGACAQSWRLALELERARPGVANAESRFRGRPSRVVNWTLAAAAAVIAAVGVVALLPQFDGGTPAPTGGSVLRGDETGSFSLEQQDEFRLDGDALILSWQPVEGASNYRLRVVDEQMNTLYAGTARQARLRLPANALPDIGDGGTVFWFVQADMADGSQRRSETGTAVVRRGEAQSPQSP